MFGTLLAGKFQFLQISERCRATRRTAKLKSVIMLPYFHRFLNLASTLRIHLARQAHLQTLSQNHKNTANQFANLPNMFYRKYGVLRLVQHRLKITNHQRPKQRQVKGRINMKQEAEADTFPYQLPLLLILFR